MKNTKLTQSRLKEFLDYNEETGIFTNKVYRSSNSKKGDIAGHTKEFNGGKFYTIISVDKRLHLAHRLAFLYMTGKYPEGDVYHLDGNGTNNKWSNLKETTKKLKIKESLTIECLKKYLSYCPETGIFTRLECRNNPNLVGGNAGYKHIMKDSGKTYIDIKLQGHIYRAHRLAFLFVTGRFPNEIDHIDGDGTNNKWCNLREVVRLENAKNHRLRTDNKTGITGVCWDKSKSKWIARIGKRDIGATVDFFEACCIRKSAEIKHNYHANHGKQRPL